MYEARLNKAHVSHTILPPGGKTLQKKKGNYERLAFPTKENLNHIMTVQFVEEERYTGIERKKFILIRSALISSARGGYDIENANSILREVDEDTMKIIFMWSDEYIKKLNWPMDALKILKNPLEVFVNNLNIVLDEQSFVNELGIIADIKYYPNKVPEERISSVNSFKRYVKLFMQNHVASLLEQIGFFDKIRISSSGSDFHFGKQVVFATFVTGGNEIAKKVFKFRDLEAENALQMILDKVKLPTLKIAPSLNMEEYVANNGKTKEVESECFNLGKMTSISAVLGIGDLHKDNLILSEKGIIPIDAEFLFIPNLIGSLAPNVLFDNGMNSGEYLGAFWNILKKLNVIDDIEKYKGKIIEGFKEGINLCKDIDFRSFFNKVSITRFSPLSTQKIAEQLVNYESNKSLSVSCLKNEIAQYFNEKHNYYNVSDIDLNVIEKQIQNSFNKFDIPYFTFNYIKQEVCINSVKFGNTKIDIFEKIKQTIKNSESLVLEIKSILDKFIKSKKEDSKDIFSGDSNLKIAPFTQKEVNFDDLS